jgi:hypothetical protein
VVYRDVTRQAKELYRLKHVGALWSGLAYLSRYNSGWFCHIELRWYRWPGLPCAPVALGTLCWQLQAVVGLDCRDDPAFTPVLPLGAGEGGDVGARHPVPKLEVISANLTALLPGPNQGVEMFEDGGAGVHPHEHLHKVGEDRHEEDGVGGEMMKLEAELLQEQEEEGGDRRNQPAHNVRIEKDELPRGQVAEGNLAGPDLPGVRRRGPPQKAPHRVQLILALEAARERKRSHGDCWEWIAKEQGREGSQAQGSRTRKGMRRRRGATASVVGKSEKVVIPLGAYLLCKKLFLSCVPRRPRRS